MDNIHIQSPNDRGESAGRLDRGETHLSSMIAPDGKIAMRSTSGDTAGNAAYPLPGTNLFNGNGGYSVMPLFTYTSLGKRLLESPYDYLTRDTMIYRSDTTPRRDGRLTRALPSTVTSPSNTATFQNGTQGDIYGR